MTTPPSPFVEKLIEKATVEIVYKDGERFAVTLQAEEWSQVRGKVRLEAYDDPPDVTGFGSACLNRLAYPFPASRNPQRCRSCYRALT